MSTHGVIFVEDIVSKQIVDNMAKHLNDLFQAGGIQVLMVFVKQMIRFMMVDYFFVQLLIKKN